MRPQLMGPLLGGAFDECLMNASPRKRARAASVGWRAIAVRALVDESAHGAAREIAMQSRVRAPPWPD